ncbi:MAG: sensor histidine kinase [Bacteroidia bacterium]
MNPDKVLSPGKEYSDILTKQEEVRLFYHRVIHDIKAPIASMMSLVKMSKSKIKNKECQVFLTEIEDHFRLLETEILSSLRNAAFYGKSIETNPVDFSDLISDVQKLLAYSRSIDKIKFHKSIRQTRPFNINRQLIFSIFQNIIDNSIKHGRLSEDSEMSINIHVKLLKRNVLIEIEDDGRGISENTKQKLFSRLDASNDLLFKGNGLGLFIIKKTIEKLNGAMSIDQINGKGTKFTILIPEA